MSGRRSWDGWRYIYANCAKEAERCRHCRGCIYFAVAGNNGCCDYYIRTGIRRPNKFGAKNCAVKIMQAGLKLPERYTTWCAEIDRKEEEKLRKQEERNKAQQTERYPGEPIREGKKRGRPLRWDAEYGEILSKHGYYYYEIAAITGATHYAVLNYAMKHGWTDNRPDGISCTRHDLSVESDRYARFVAARENGDADDAFIENLFGEPSRRYGGGGLHYGVLLSEQNHAPQNGGETV